MGSNRAARDKAAILAWDFQQLCTQQGRPASSHKKERCTMPKTTGADTPVQLGSEETVSTDSTATGSIQNSICV